MNALDAQAGKLGQLRFWFDSQDIILMMTAIEEYIFWENCPENETAKERLHTCSWKLSKILEDD